MDGKFSEVKRGEVFLGRYQIESLLGCGGFCTVFKARQLTTGQDVAVKTLRPLHGRHPDPDTLRARFKLEMELCAKLHHPNIVRLIDSGQTDDGQLFAILAFVPGRDLAKTLAEEGPLVPHEAVYLMGQALDALAAAHRLGVVHRDLKPANIMVTATGARRNATVLDFGIGAFVREACEAGPKRLTQTGDIVCSPHYAAPEQLRGELPSTRTDLYSWGLVFLECLTGVQAVPAATDNEAIYQQLRPTPVRLPEPLWAHPLGRLLERVTQKDEEERTLSAAEALRILDSCDLSALSAADFTEAKPTRSLEHGGGDVGEPSRGAATGHRAPRSRRGRTAELGAANDGRELDRETESGSREANRRQITVAACSFWVEAPEGREVDFEETERWFESIRQHCEHEVRRLGGSSEAMPGERLLLYFGYPTAHEHDPLLAVQLAHSLQLEVESQAARAEAVAGPVPEVRIGVHTGMAIARQETSPDGGRRQKISGNAPNVAIALNAIAGPGSVVVSADTRKLLKDTFSFSCRGVHQLIGQSSAVEVFEVSGGSGRAASLDAFLHEETTRFVARAAETALLRDAWRKARGGSGTCLTLVGEPGIGKSRLLREFIRTLDDDGDGWLQCRCARTAHSTALVPLLELLEQWTGDPSHTASERRAARLERLLTENGMALAEHMPQLAALLGLPRDERFPVLDGTPEQRKEATLDSLLTLLLNTARRRPSLVVVEDIHWCDPTTLELLEALVQEAPTAPLLLVLTARPTALLSWSADEVQQVQLSGLSRQQTEEMIAGITGACSVAPELVDDVFRRTDGVALYVEELIRMYLDLKLVEQRHGRLVAIGKPTATTVPASLRDLLTERLDRTGDARYTVQVAATLGREFLYEFLAEVIDLDEETLAAHVTTLVRLGLIRRRGFHRKQVIAFKHALFRDIAYDSLLKAPRQKLHRDVAIVIESKHPDWVERRPDLLAEHWAEAGVPHRALTHAVTAGERSLEAAAYAEAVNHFTAARRHFKASRKPGEDPAQELALTMKLAVPVMMTRGFSSAELWSLYEQARATCRRIGDTPELFRVVHGMWTYYLMRGDLPDALPLAERCMRMAERSGDPVLKIEAHLALGNSLSWIGELHASEEHVGEIEKRYREQDRDQRKLCLQRLGFDPLVACYSFGTWGRLSMGFVQQALERAQRAMTIGQAIDDAHVTAMALQDLSMARVHRREWHEARQAAQALVDLATDKALAFWRALGQVLLGRAVTALGDDGLGLLREGIEGCHAVGSRLCDGMFNCLLAEALLERGELDEMVVKTLDQTIQLASERRTLLFEAELHRLRGEALAHHGGNGRAADCFNTAFELATGRDQMLWALRAACSGVRHERRQGNQERLRAARDRLAGTCEWFSEGFGTPDLQDAEMLLETSA